MLEWWNVQECVNKCGLQMYFGILVRRNMSMMEQEKNVVERGLVALLTVVERRAGEIVDGWEVYG